MKVSQVSFLRIGVLLIGTVAVFAGLIGKLYFLQIVKADKIVSSSERSRNFYKTIPPTRGLILDRNNRPLAQNTLTYTVKAAKQSIDNVTAAILRIGAILDLSASEMNRHIAALQRKEVEGREIKKSVSEELKGRIEAADIPGIYVEPHTTRFYPEGSLAAHVIGYTGDDNTGLEGLEHSLNGRIEGTPQPIVTDKDIRRRMIADEDYTKIMTRGVDYVLTLDSYIQYVVERELKNVCEETAALQANAIVLHPASGDILAMANYPAYDPNRYAEFSPDIRKNRLLVDIFEPGSILKPFIMAAALEQRVVTPQMTFYCERGSFYFYGHTIRDDIHRFDNLTVHDILVYSSNIGMVKIAQRLGSGPNDFRGQAEILQHYLRLFGFKNRNEKTTEDLPGETGGLFPAKWWPATLGAVPFGQGISTNTLVLAGAYGALANRGVYRTPRIILGKRRSDGLFQASQPEKPTPVISNRVAEQIVQMMIDVTEDPEGTGRRVRIPGFHIAGKTGTAQKPDLKNGGYIPRARIASFAGFFPAENPQAVIIVVVDEPKNKKYGGEVSGPVFLKIAEELIAYWGLSPSDKNDPLYIAALNRKNKSTPNSASIAASTVGFPIAFGVNKEMPISPWPTSPESPGVMPDLIGLPIREAVVRLAVNGLRGQFEGSGKVVAQSIPAGTALAGNEDVGIVRCEPVLTDPDIQTTSEWVVQR